MRASEFVTEKWSEKYKRSINCNNPKGFSQRAHCQGKKKKLKEVSDPFASYSTNEPIRELSKAVRDKLKESALYMKNALASEKEETKQMMTTIKKLLNKEPVTKEEQKSAKRQFIDLLKLAGLGTIVAIVPMVGVAELVLLVGKLLYKYTSINILPTAFV